MISTTASYTIQTLTEHASMRLEVERLLLYLLVIGLLGRWLSPDLAMVFLFYGHPLDGRKGSIFFAKALVCYDVSIGFVGVEIIGTNDRDGGSDPGPSSDDRSQES
jgi:hypothetical protein